MGFIPKIGKYNTYWNPTAFLLRIKTLNISTLKKWHVYVNSSGKQKSMEKILAFFVFATGLSTGFAQDVTTVAGVLETPGINDGQALSARFNNPHGLAVDAAGNVYIADRYNHTIRKYTASTTQVTTLAGSAGVPGQEDGQGANAQFNEPWGICVTDGGIVFVADTRNNKIRKVTPDGVVTTIAGTGIFGVSNGPALSATFGNPTGIDIDANGVIYVADHLTHVIRKIDTNGLVSTIAGTPYIPGSVDGQGSLAQFWRPYGLTLEAGGNILIADEWNQKIRRLTPDGQVSTIAGAGIVGYVDGPAMLAAFNYPWDITTDDAGNIYVADGYNYLIRKIASDGTVSTLAGKALNSGGVDGTGINAAFNGATALEWFNSDTIIYVADAYNHLIRKIDLGSTAVTLSLSAYNGKTQICAGDTLRLESYPPGLPAYRFRVDGLLVQNSFSPDYRNATLTVGTHTISVETDVQGGVPAQAQITVTVAPIPQPILVATPGLQVFTGDSVSLSASIQGGLLWSTGDTSAVIVVFQSGSYFVRATVNGCQGDSEPVTIQVINPPPPAGISVEGDTLLCPGESVLLVSSAMAGNQWLKNGQFIPGATGQMLEVSTAGTYRVRVEDPQTSQILVSQPVNISLAPDPDFDFDAEPRSVQPGEAIQFQVSGWSDPDELVWDFGYGGAAYSYLEAPVFSYLQPGVYTISLTLTDEFGCRDTLVKQGFVTVANSIEPEQFIPTAFTPNGDGANDVFLVRGPQLSDFSMAIFNEWGESVHFSSDQLRGWDGIYNASPAPNGTYVYLIQYRSADGIGRQVSGHITLIR